MALVRAPQNVTGDKAIEWVEDNLKSKLNNKDITDIDNWSKVDELLNNIKKDWQLNTSELNDLYSQITWELNTKWEASTIEDASLRKVANVIAKLWGLSDWSFYNNVDYKTFIAELWKEYKPTLDKTINSLNDWKPEVIKLWWVLNNGKSPYTRTRS